VDQGATTNFGGDLRNWLFEILTPRNTAPLDVLSGIRKHLEGRASVKKGGRRSSLWLVSGGIRLRLGYDKLLEDIGNSGLADPKRCRRKYYSYAVAIFRRVVEIGNSSGSKIPEDT